ncbi:MULTISPECIES: tyrosine-type recombinase/integrase [unclassified Polynucleobacter]|uniref:tyrosine-type recombinase/integrase n=1 Tax=unclassified Polynucleobacter TaxID=2640945 RepID=UPI002573EA3A|nr:MULTISPECIES: tyrosine-type recombinase/integrase [unclassified Polynucleobacter]
MQNLQYFFAHSATQELPKAVALLGGELTLFKRSHSSKWQCRFKLPNGQWHSASTNTDDLVLAQTQAVVIYETIKIKVSAGLSPVTKTFRQVAADEIDRMAQAMNNQVGKRTYRDYTFAINKYLIPFFGKYEVGQITTELISDFESWRASEMGKIPMASTKRNHASAYARVINLARDHGLVGINQPVPMLDAKGRASQARPAFTEQEITELLSYTQTWQRSSYTMRTAHMRTLCTYYIEFLVNTGVRHGTEALPLRWRHLQWHWIGNRRYLRIWVSGKTGPRYLIAKNAVIRVFEQIIRWHKLPYSGLAAVIEAKLDALIFRLPTGEQISNMENIFRNLMVRSHMRTDGSGQNRTLYSLRHTYATLALAKGVDIHTLARQMGTSVGMIERHYSKLTPMMNAEKLA